MRASPTIPVHRIAALVAGLVLLAAGAAGCRSNSCLDGREGCEVEPPCEEVSFACSGAGDVLIQVVGAGDVGTDRVPGGLQAEGGIGDVVLRNDFVHVLVEGLENRNYLGPSGGNLLDLATTGVANDAMTHMMVATGILPGDAVYYESMRIVAEGPDVAAVQFLGRLDGHPDVRVNTRYEIRRCDRGVRIRTELYNGATVPALWPVYDTFWWGVRQVQPFAPLAGVGFEHPGLDLVNLDDILFDFPFMAAATHTEASISYGITGCNVEQLEGFNTEEVSAVGLGRRIVPPRDYRVYERILVAADASHVAGAADIVAGIREQIFGEPYVTLAGRVVLPDGTPVGGDGARASLHFLEIPSAPDPAGGAIGGGPIPRTQVVPEADGTFAVRVPRDRSYEIALWAFGVPVASHALGTVAGDTDVADLVLPEAARLTVSVTVDGAPADAQVFVHPADAATEAAVLGRLNGVYTECAPLLGSPTGPSPACNRVLVREGGPVTAELPDGGGGRYHVYATVGPFATLARETVTVAAGEETVVELALERLPVAPGGALSADLHVHGGRSFDSSLPEYDRVLSFLAASVDVIAATEHEVIHDYAEGLAALDASDRLKIMPGLESTGFILWLDVPGAVIPRVVGHWNFWPLQKDPSLPSGGAPWTQLAEPGELFERLDGRWAGEPVIQLNHPWGGSFGGRDYGFPQALEMDAKAPLDANARNRMFGRVPDCGPEPGTGCAEVLTPNDAYHVQEVMNGTDNSRFLQYRSFWFYLLNAGVVRAGTANSDTHSLVDNVVGTPRNLVFAETSLDDFDVDAFNEAVRGGRMIGTNGPVIEIATTDAAGTRRTPSTEAFAPASGGELEITVRAAPWVTVDEVRIYVNGELARTITEDIAAPADPFGAEGLLRFDGRLPLSEILPPGDRDAWIVVEAGHPLITAADLSGDGIVDTSDNTGDGQVTLDDVDPDDRDACYDCAIQDHKSCADGRIGSGAHSCGPLLDPDPPQDESDPRFHFNAVTPGGYPLAFTNPLLLDRDGNGVFDGSGLPKEGE